jgi:hypothetical protein
MAVPLDRTLRRLTKEGPTQSSRTVTVTFSAIVHDFKKYMLSLAFKEMFTLFEITQAFVYCTRHNATTRHEAVDCHGGDLDFLRIVFNRFSRLRRKEDERNN